MGILRSLLLLAAGFSTVAFTSNLPWHSDIDLTRFVTRPEIKVPLFNITYKSDVGVTAGYWFVAPYASIQQHKQRLKYYQPCSTGPAIYDHNGELVWTGACQLLNQNVCDLRAFRGPDGAEQLSLLVMGYEPGLNAVASIMDNSFQMIANHSCPADETRVNMHEWNIVDNGRSGIYITHKSKRMDITELNLEDRKQGWIAVPGFREIDLATGATKFEWFNDGHISLLESTNLPRSEGELAGPWPNSWNWCHPNSVDKDAEGNYLLSSRFTDTVYKIDDTGEIVWRLGGRNSSFQLNDFNFSKQHDARFISKDGHIEIVSFFDNGWAAHPGLEVEATSNYSSALVVKLDHKAMTASVVSRIIRPDGGRTNLRGNHQILPNGNHFVSWADNAYISESSADGKLLLEAKWQTNRFVTYRGYKFNFTAVPSELPVMKAIVYGVDPRSSTTSWYASWNGATEVAEWHFYGSSRSSSSSSSSSNINEDGNGTISDGLFHFIGSVPRAGFETSFVSDGFANVAYAEAVAKNGTILGRTKTEYLTLPIEWDLRKLNLESEEMLWENPRIELPVLYFKAEL